jgi:prepilin-type N-terminal cleavage/methylation domain-containing protein
VTRSRSAFTLIEVLVTIALVAALFTLILQFGRYFAVGYNTGEQVFSELREAGLILERIRADAERWAIDPARPDLGFAVAAGQTSFTRSADGRLETVTYVFSRERGVISRRAGSDPARDLGGGLVTDAKFEWTTLCAAKDGLAPCAPGGPTRPQRAYLTVRLSLGTPGVKGGGLSFTTHVFPHWANRQLTSMWNREKKS